MKIFPKKYYFLVLGFFVFLGIYAPLFYAKASIWSKITDIAGGIILNTTPIDEILKIAWALAAQLFAILAWLSHSILIWIIGNPLPGISLTNPATNPIINIGWTIMRDLTNMAFILGLAYIGMATALDIGGKFKTAITFRNILLIALLINFTPVICGAIIDGTNIISRFFLSNISFTDVLLQAEKNIGSGAASIVTGLLSAEKNIAGLVNIGGSAFLMLLFCVIFGLFSLLFLLRIIFVWFLVILSPLAFFAWIFDGTRKYFKQWWDLFIQWAIIIVPASFFLYLSMHIFTLAPKMFSTPF